MHAQVQSLVVEPKPKKHYSLPRQISIIKSIFLHMMDLTNYTTITFKIITDSWSFPCSLSLNKVFNGQQKLFSDYIKLASLLTSTTGMVCCKVHSTACPHLKNGKSNYTQGGHVRAHMLEKCTPSSGRISSSRCWPLCMQTHTHSVQPQGQLSQGEIEREIG